MNGSKNKKPVPGRRNIQNKPGKKPPLPTYKRGPFSWLIIAVIVFTGILMLKDIQGVKTIVWSEFVEHVNNDRIESILIKDTEITGKFRKSYLESQKEETKESFNVVYKEAMLDSLAELEKTMLANKVEIVGDPPHVWVYMLMQWLLPLLFFGALIYFMFIRNLRSGAGGMLMSFGRSKHKLHGKDRVQVTFKDVAGVRRGQGRSI